MSKHTGFMEYAREDPQKLPVKERVLVFDEFEGLLPLDKLEIQAARCMDCGIPYCHSFGCPIKNRIPEWNNMVHKGDWRRALDLLHDTNNFPEFTGKICPAPCEASCTLSINQPPVTIKHIELEIVERGWKEGWIVPEPAPYKTGKKVAIIGSGPAGLCAAQELARLGHEVIVYERSDRIGGLLRYGIPDFKLDKSSIDRRIEQMESEGVQFRTGENAGVSVGARDLTEEFDAIGITAGSIVPRDLPIQGRNLDGIHFAMKFLTQQNRRVAGDIIPPDESIIARDKHVIVIGGGDTGSDCIGTSRRQGAKSIHQLEILQRPPDERAPANPWPVWPNIFRISSSQEEGCERMFGILTKKFTGENNRVKKIECVKVEWLQGSRSKPPKFKEISGSEFELNAGLVLLAMGFVRPEHGPLVKDLSLDLDKAGNIIVDSKYMTSRERVFAAGDCVTGQSLVVRAMYEGRQLAKGIDLYLD